MSDLLLAARLLHRAMRYRWRLNRREIAAMLPLIPRGGVALDVGAHKGAYSWWMARAVGPAGRVFAFEPQERLIGLTSRSLAASGMRQVRVIHAAVSDHSGTEPISIRRTSTHGASLDGLQGADIDNVQVPVISLDEFVAGESLDRVDFLKIDVEGHEPRVLAGALHTLDQFGPALLVELEIRHHDGGDPIGAARASLEPLGYHGVFFTRTGCESVDRFDAGAHQRYGEGYYSNNFLFVRGESGARAAAARASGQEIAR